VEAGALPPQAARMATSKNVESRVIVFFMGPLFCLIRLNLLYKLEKKMKK
jgi:hypothetical protein